MRERGSRDGRSQGPGARGGGVARRASGRGRATAGRRAGGRESPHPFVPGFDGAVGHDLIVCLEHTHTNRGRERERDVSFNDF